MNSQLKVRRTVLVLAVILGCVIGAKADEACTADVKIGSNRYDIASYYLQFTIRGTTIEGSERIVYNTPFSSPPTNTTGEFAMRGNIANNVGDIFSIAYDQFLFDNQSRNVTHIISSAGAFSGLGVTDLPLVSGTHISCTPIGERHGSRGRF